MAAAVAAVESGEEA
ncbi:hypothetical protein VCHC55A1_3749, partial [Vibrio cholerae HC-55A1]